MFECRINLKVLEIWFYPKACCFNDPHNAATQGKNSTVKNNQRDGQNKETVPIRGRLIVVLSEGNNLHMANTFREGYKRNARSSDLPARDQQQIATFIRGKLVVGQTALKETRKGEEPRKRRIAFPVSCKILSF
jgi:hypothetical protein